MRVPQYQQQEQLRALPGVRQQIATPAGAFGDGGKLAGELANSLGNVAVAMQREKDLADQTRVDEALNRWKEYELDLTFNPDSGYTTQKGAQAMYRPSGKPLTDEYYENANKYSADLENGLGNDRQKQLFRQRINDQLTQFRGGLMRYEGQEFRKYQVSVQDGKIATEARTIASYYNDPDKINQSVEAIRQATYTTGRLRGLSGEEINARTTEVVSKAHVGAIAQAMDKGDVMYADQYLKTYKEQLTPEDMLRVRSKIGEQVETVVANQLANQVFVRVESAANPTDMDRVLQITMQAESGGRRYGANGGLLESPAGAKGEMQVMDATNRDPGFGVTPARDDSPDERARVGREYMGAMVKKYEGDLARAWAAYNAGPGAVDNALAAAAREGNPSAWLSKLPKETQDYVRKNSAAFSSGGGRSESPTIDQVKAELRNNPVLADRPEALRKAEEAVDRRFADFEKAQQQRQNNALAEALRFVEEGGNFDALPAGIKNNLSPTKYSTVRDYEKKVRGGDAATNLAAYQLLASDPKRVREMSDDEFYALRTELSASDFKKFADMRSDKVGARDNPEALSFETINQVLNPRLRGMNLPIGNAGSPADQQRVGAIRQHMTDVILAEQQAAGRKLTQGEIVRVVDREFLTARELRTDAPWYRPWGDGEVRKVRPLDTKVGDIPAELRRQIEADFKQQGIDRPTDQEILRAFFAVTTQTRRE